MSDMVLPADRPVAAPASQGTIVEQTRAAAEVAAAVEVARRFPRDRERASAEVIELCGQLAVAERAFYAVDNRGSGLSIHIAREIARIWGNVDYGVRELSRDDLAGMSEMTAWAWDQETNSRSWRTFLVPHARMKQGRRTRLTDLSDVYLNNQNIGARAVRECVFAILPDALLAQAETVLRETLRRGDGKPVAERAREAAEGFARELGITEPQLVRRVGRPVEKWTADDLADLTRVWQSIVREGIPVVEFFPEGVVEVPVGESDTTP